MNDIYEVYNDTGALMGKFMISHNQLTVLSDYFGMLFKNFPEGPIDEASYLMVKDPLGGLKVVSRSDIKNGLYLNNIPTAEFKTKYQDKVFEDTRAERPPSIFNYFREGMKEPHTVEFSNGKILLDGNLLSEEESNRILENVSSGLAQLRYKDNQMAKSEPELVILKKSDDITPEEAMQHISGLVGQGHVRPEVEQALRKHIFEDSMMEGLGNRYSFDMFKNKAKPGYWLSLDLNDFRHINNTHGHSTGDMAIKTFGKAVRESIDRSPFKERTKAWRTGGDEIAIYSESPDSLHHVLRGVHGHLNDVPSIGGTHKVSVASGLGSSYEEADAALLEAKKKKTTEPSHLHHSSLKPSSQK